MHVKIRLCYTKCATRSLITEIEVDWRGEFEIVSREIRLEVRKRYGHDPEVAALGNQRVRRTSALSFDELMASVPTCMPSFQRFGRRAVEELHRFHALGCDALGLAVAVAAFVQLRWVRNSPFASAMFFCLKSITLVNSKFSSGMRCGT